MEIEFKKRVILEGIPSASGVEFYNGHLYITSDNSPWLYKLDKHYNPAGRIKIYDSPEMKGDTIPKAIKPDFEAMTLLQERDKTFLYVFGSGSKSPYRDVLVKIDTDGENNRTVHDMTEFYTRLKQAGPYANEDFNIEGVAYFDSGFIFLNRATNDLLRVELADFNAFLINPASPTDITRFHFTLPAIRTIESRFSGCVAIPGLHKMLFTTSVENTADWIADGEVLGSFMGILSLEDAGNETPQCFQIEKEATVPLKIESIAIRKVKGNSIELLMVSDNDEGQSELVEALLRW